MAKDRFYEILASHLETMKEAARTLLKPQVPVVVLHSLTDAFPNPSINADSSHTLLRAHIGTGMDESNENLVMITFQSQTNGIFKTASEGFGGSPGMARSLDGVFRHLLSHLDQPLCHVHLPSKLAATAGFVHHGQLH